jgi:5-methylcytosine-specific restriction endonuclease McrA
VARCEARRTPRALIAAGAFVKAVLHDGKQVTHVAHYGRNLTAELRTALGLGQPPAFDGRRCSEPGCERRLGLEVDHLDPVAHGGPTSLENLELKCSVHHQEKTGRDRAAGLFDQGP